MLAHQVGKSEIAVELMSKALTLKPDCAEFYYNLGIVQNYLWRPEEASSNFRRAISLKSDYVEAHNNLGVILKDQGNLEEALVCFRRALSLKPDYAEAHNNLGNVFQAQGKLDDAIASYRLALNLKQDFADALFNLGTILQTQGKQNEALACFHRVVTLQPDYAEAHINLGSILSNQGKLEEALASLRKALILKPDLAEVHNNLGIIYAELGMIDDAATCYKQALSLKPDYAEAYRNLSAIMKFSEGDDVIHAMEDLFNNKGDIPEADHIHLGFALGKAFENLRNYEKSFHFILAANRLKRQSYDYSTQEDHDLFDRIMKTFSPDFFSSHYGSGNKDRTPIFILGMLRSGTTLAEQILASHPLVFGAGELEVLRNLTTGICIGKKTPQFPECLRDLNMDDFQRLGSDYIEKIREYSKNAEYITDKMPGNFLWVGLIKIILPRAKIIHCVRNPMDICFSIFKNDFTATHKYAYNMTELGQYYNLYRDLMAHWEKVLPGFMYTLRYEDMISDQEHQTKSLLEFCGLPWDDACMAFHKTKRKVSTASLAQVRQPIYKDSVELWKQYAKQLEPLRKAIYG
jgi:tetratricopeptide (TPR) repeat protein